MHTPTPWHIGKHHKHTVFGNEEEIVVPADGLAVRAAVDNAAFIVQAVNAHERLKDALILLTSQLNRDFDMTDDDRVTEQLAQAYMNARALLAEVEGGR